MKKDIENINDIKLLVDTFYGFIREDEMLAGIFNSKIEDRWPEHLERMYTFWQTVLLDEHTYYGSPFLPHAKLPISKEHFMHWISLFNKTIDELFLGETATKAKWQAERMAEMFHSKIEYYKNNSGTPLL